MANRFSESRFFRSRKPSWRYRREEEEEDEDLDRDSDEDSDWDEDNDRPVDDDVDKSDNYDEFGEVKNYEGYIAEIDGLDFEIVDHSGDTLELRDAEGETQTVDISDVDSIYDIEEVYIEEPVKIGDIIAQPGDIVIIQSDILNNSRPAGAKDAFEDEDEETEDELEKKESFRRRRREDHKERFKRRKLSRFSKNKKEERRKLVGWGMRESQSSWVIYKDGSAVGSIDFDEAESYDEAYRIAKAKYGASGLTVRRAGY